ncbi:hypothetical protein Tco_1244923 [Tanacetum coccineum]
MFYNFQVLGMNLDIGLHALSCNDDVRFLSQFKGDHKVIKVNIAHGCTKVYTYYNPKPTISSVENDEIHEDNDVVTSTYTQNVLKMLFFDMFPHHVDTSVDTQRFTKRLFLDTVPHVETQEDVVEESLNVEDYQLNDMVVDHTVRVDANKDVNHMEVDSSTRVEESQGEVNDLSNSPPKQPAVCQRVVQDALQKKCELNVSHIKALRAEEMVDMLIKVEYPEDHNAPTRVFKYVCLGALKQGFKATGRELFGLDGTFISGPFPREVLTVVGIDATNGLYLVAYRIVEAECKDSWHIHENMKKYWNRLSYMQMLCKYATTIIIQGFKAAMKELKSTSVVAHAWLSQIPPQHWARSHCSGQGGAGSSFGSSNKKKSKGKAASGSGRDSGGASGKGKVVTEPTRKTKKVKEYSSRYGGVSVGASVVSQNGASSPTVQTSLSSCHGTAGQNVQGDQSSGADYSGNGGGFKTWVSYSGSATVATPASSAGQTIQGVESGGPSKSHIGTTNSGNGKSPDVPRNEDHIAKPEISRRINGHDGRDPRDVEIERLRQRVCELEIQHEIRQIRKRIRELELQREMRKETQIEIPSVWDEDEPKFDEDEVDIEEGDGYKFQETDSESFIRDENYETDIHGVVAPIIVTPFFRIVMETKRPETCVNDLVPLVANGDTVASGSAPVVKIEEGKEMVSQMGGLVSGEEHSGPDMIQGDVPYDPGGCGSDLCSQACENSRTSFFEEGENDVDRDF